MVAKNAGSGFIKDTEPEPVREKESKKLHSKKLTEKVEIEEFVYTAETKD